MQDPDLRALRERREWLDAQEELAGVIDRSTQQSLRAEAKAPFRLTRTVIAGGLAIGAGLGLLVITVKLIAVATGAPNAPDARETIQNFGINLASMVALLWFVQRDIKAKTRDEKKVQVEEELGRLQVLCLAIAVVLHAAPDLATTNRKTWPPAHALLSICSVGDITVDMVY
jgi:hypothetical protein